MKHYLPTKQQNKIWILVLLTFIFTHSALVTAQAQISLTEESLPSKDVEIISLQKENYYSFETTPMTNVGSEDVFIIQGSNQKQARLAVGCVDTGGTEGLDVNGDPTCFCTSDR